MGKLTWGADPEFFLQSVETGEIVPAFAVADKLELGTKAESRPITSYPDVGVLADGAALEFNLKQPYDSDDLMWAVLNEGVRQFDHVLRQHKLKRTGYRSVVIPPQYLDHPEMQQIGCDPDCDAYSGGSKREGINPDMFKNDDGLVWRGAGGHIHIGIDPWPEIPKHIFVQFLDWIYSAMTPAGHKPTLSTDRIYRRMGLYRDKPYGVEYRSPASWWVNDYQQFSLFADRVWRLNVALEQVGSPQFMELLGHYRDMSALPPAAPFYIHKRNMHMFRILGALGRGEEPEGDEPVEFVEEQEEIPLGRVEREAMRRLADGIIAGEPLEDILNEARAANNG